MTARSIIAVMVVATGLVLIFWGIVAPGVEYGWRIWANVIGMALAWGGVGVISEEERGEEPEPVAVAKPKRTRPRVPDGPAAAASDVQRSPERPKRRTAVGSSRRGPLSDDWDDPLSRSN